MLKGVIIVFRLIIYFCLIGEMLFLTGLCLVTVAAGIVSVFVSMWLLFCLLVWLKLQLGSRCVSLA